MKEDSIDSLLQFRLESLSERCREMVIVLKGDKATDFAGANAVGTNAGGQIFGLYILEAIRRLYLDIEHLRSLGLTERA
jgi:hypothetical protein